MKVSVSAGLSVSPLCVECGGVIGFDGLVMGLYAEPSRERPDSLRMLGEFCEECAGRFTTRTTKGRASLLDPGIAVHPKEARQAALRAAKRLRKLARELENAEYVVD